MLRLKQTNVQTNKKQTDIDRQTDRPIGGDDDSGGSDSGTTMTERQADRQTNRQTDR